MTEHSVGRPEIHGYFNNRTIALIEAAGLKAMGWQEITGQPLPPSTGKFERVV